VVLLAAPPQRAPPEIGDVVSERVERPGIRGYGVIREEPRHHRLQPSTLFRNGVMHAVTQLRLDLPKLRSHTVCPRLALKLERTAPGLTADEREPQEGEGFRFAKPSPLALSRRCGRRLEFVFFQPV
jgi:hypothetical protein